MSPGKTFLSLSQTTGSGELRWDGVEAPGLGTHLCRASYRRGYSVPQHVTAVGLAPVSGTWFGFQWHLVWVSVVKSTGGEAVLPPGQSSDGQSLLPMAAPHSCAFTVMMTSTEHCLDPCLESAGLPLIFQSSSRGMMIL